MKEPGNREKPAKHTGQSEDHGRAERKAPLSQAIHARVNRPHKGDVGRPQANEEIFQGSKMKELR
jgi:hypothetical protein